MKEPTTNYCNEDVVTETGPLRCASCGRAPREDENADDDLYRPNDRGWVKVKNPNYWRRDAGREAMSRKHARRTPGRSGRVRA